MDNLNELRTIWKTANTGSLPVSGEMLSMVKRFRNEKIRNKISLIVASSLLLIFFVVNWFFMSPHLITTTIGTAMEACSVAIVAITNIRSIGRFNRLNDCTNKEFILFLEQTRRNQLFYFEKTQVACISLASAGLLLYLYEAARQDTLLLVIVYTVSFACIGFLWFYLRPVKFKKQIAKTNDMIENLKKISDQLQ